MRIAGRHSYEITSADVGHAFILVAGRWRQVSSSIGRILARDVGKRVFLVDDVLQIENDAQRDKRVGRTS